MIKRTIVMIFIASIFNNDANCQIKKGNWLVGGSANFSYNNSNTDVNNTKITTINLAPNIGYFFIDKFAGGLRLSFYNNHIKFGPPNNNFTTFTTSSIGPFVRYYFLPIDNPYNILSEVSYQFGNEKIKTNNPSTSNSNSNSFSFSVGPVIYFNSTAGIEFLLNYTTGGENLSNKRSNSFGAGIGFQIHLEKEKN